MLPPNWPVTVPPDIVSDEIVAVVPLTLNTRSFTVPRTVVTRVPAPMIVTGVSTSSVPPVSW
jgi:hypothetical protein